MGEISDENLLQRNIGVLSISYPTQSEGGAVGAVHGAQLGADRNVYSISGLLLMIPNMYKLPVNWPQQFFMLPHVRLHVRSSIFGITAMLWLSAKPVYNDCVNNCSGSNGLCSDCTCSNTEARVRLCASLMVSAHP